jgi:hypothetical protein
MPDWLALLMPVAVGWATVRFGAASTRVTAGAVAVGLSEIVAMGAGLIGGPENPTFAISATVRAVSFVLLAGGLLWLARGLEVLRSGTPSTLARRGALLGLGIGVAVTAIELVARVAQTVGFDYVEYAGDEGRAILIANLVSVTYVLVPLAWAYLGWVLIRSDGDVARPPRATRLGAWAGWLRIAWLGTSLVGLAWLPFASRADLEPGEGPTMLSTILLVVAVTGAAIAVAAIALLVAGIAVGLASQPARAAQATPAHDAAAEPA